MQAYRDLDGVTRDYGDVHASPQIEKTMGRARHHAPAALCLAALL